MIERTLQKEILRLASKFPVVSVTGPRQSGKTTLIRHTFPDYTYTSLEDPDIRLFAETDPRGFLSADKPMVIDEIQRVPQLFSYLQTITDQQKSNGQFIISGSQSFLLNERISQSLAGRVAILHLLPLSYNELKRYGIVFSSHNDLIFKGFFPRVYDHDIAASDFYPSYIQTYVERDVRLLQQIQNLSQFIRFMKLCAGRTGQLLNLSSLANDAGVSVNTAKAWISVLEASFVVFLLQPHYENFNKRLVKMPKLYFHDTGLACALLDLQSSAQLQTHYLVGGLFENFIISELLKTRYNSGQRSNCYFWRDHKGKEIDCVLDFGQLLKPIEIKATTTFTENLFNNINYWNKLSGNLPEHASVIYGGDKSFVTKHGQLLSWREMGAMAASSNVMNV